MARPLEAIDPEVEFGAMFDDTADDTAALQAALNAAKAEKGGTVLLKRRAKITGTLSWPRNVRLLGAGFGDGSGSAFYPTLRWAGAAGGTMLEVETNAGITAPAADAMFVKFDGGTSNTSGCIVHSVDRLDWDFSFVRCSFARCNGDAVVLDKGATNLHFNGFRADSIAGYFLKTAQGGAYSLDKFTLDTGSSGTAKGLMFFDPSTSSQQASIGVSNARIELNSALAGNKAIVQLDLPNVGDPIGQAFLTFSNVMVSTVAAASGTALAKNVGGSTYDQWCATGTNTFFTGAAAASCQLAVGSTVSGPPAGKMYPLWAFAPFTTGGATNSPPYRQDIWLGP